MTLLVGALTSIPIIWGAAIGFRRGGGRLCRHAVGWLWAWGAGALVASWGYREGWFWPAGLITPLIVAFPTAWAVWRLFFRLFPRSDVARRHDVTHSVHRFDCLVGVVLGGAGGFGIALPLWWIAMLSCGPSHSLVDRDTPIASAGATPRLNVPPKKSWATALVQTAHEGFLHHLPLAGPVSDEVEALASILRTPLDLRARYARSRQWGSLASLPSMQSLASSDEAMQELEQVSRGNVAALYRLQKRPEVAQFFQEPQVQKLLPGLRATTIARDLSQFAEEGP